MGCPISDGDQDGIADADDACPDRAGAASLEAQRNGCPLELVEEREDRLLTRQPIVFAPGTDVLLAENLPVLQALAQAIEARPWIQHPGLADRPAAAAARERGGGRRALAA